MRNTLTFILAGGRGERLDPLTRDRAKPAVPFGGNYRIIDFSLSNCINSGLRKIFILSQYKSFSLQKHLLSGWDVVSNQLGEFIDIIPAQQRISSDWYKGTADAIYQNLYAIKDCDPQLILILAGDHIYKMDYRAMVSFLEQKDADVVVACVPVPKELAINFGVIEVDDDNRIRGFQEKPEDPKTIPHDSSRVLASMGIYLFKKDILVDELTYDAQADSAHDFGKNVIPHMVMKKMRVYVYQFVDEKKQEKYWRDIGTRDAYYQSNMDLLGPHPIFDLYDKSWPVRTCNEQRPPTKIIRTASGHVSIIDSLISGGCVIENALVDHSILSSSVRVCKNAKIKNSIIMDNVVIGKNVSIQNAIIDKEVNIPDEVKIGYCLKEDQKRYAITSSGIVIVPKRMDITR